MSVWSDDGVWQVRDDLVFTGPDEIRAAIERQWASVARAFHWVSNPSITVDENGVSAHARFDVHAETQLIDESWISSAGSYSDAYVKTQLGWRMRERIAEVHSQRIV